jgi:hypothetical protein
MSRERNHMAMTKAKYVSPSTPSVSHNLGNFIVEAILINRHGALPDAAWRKGQPFAKEWGRLLTCVRRINNTFGVELEQLAWFVQFYKITNLNYKDFGLLRWKVKQYFKWCNVDRFVTYYTRLHEQLTAKSSSYVEESTGYKTKDASTTKPKTLSEILQELENGEG